MTSNLSFLDEALPMPLGSDIDTSTDFWSLDDAPQSPDIRRSQLLNECWEYGPIRGEEFSIDALPGMHLMLPGADEPDMSILSDFQIADIAVNPGFDRGDHFNYHRVQAEGIDWTWRPDYQSDGDCNIVAGEGALEELSQVYSDVSYDDSYLDFPTLDPAANPNAPKFSRNLNLGGELQPPPQSPMSYTEWSPAVIPDEGLITSLSYQIPDTERVLRSSPSLGRVSEPRMSKRSYKENRQRIELKREQRRFKCNIDGCTSEYASPSTVLRHRQNTHWSNFFFAARCLYPTCRTELWAGTEPKAWDNLKTHQNQKHASWILHRSKEERCEMRVYPKQYPSQRRPN